MAGQRLFGPPGVQGWDDATWLDTSTIRGRWETIRTAIAPFAIDPAAPSQQPPLDADALVASALDFWDDPTISSASLGVLRDFAARGLAAIDLQWKRTRYPVNILNALRQLVAFPPDYET